MAVPIYQLKVRLLGTKPPIYRRILVKGSITLGELHDVLQIVMGWTNSHLHHFIFRLPKEEMKRAREEIAHGKRDPWEYPRDTYYSDPQFELEETEDEWRARLDRVAPAEKAKFVYEYDMGDSWQHEITVEKIRPPKKGEALPVCVTGKLACPPEDCGGVWGYYDLLDALADRKHERHEELKEWVPEGFDANVFSVDDVNRMLRSTDPPRGQTRG